MSWEEEKSWDWCFWREKRWGGGEREEEEEEEEEEALGSGVRMEVLGE